MPPRVPIEPSLRYVYGDPYAPAYLPSEDDNRPVRVRNPETRRLMRMPDTIPQYRGLGRSKIKKDIVEYFHMIQDEYDPEEFVNMLELFASEQKRNALQPALGEMVLHKQKLDDCWKAHMKKTKTLPPGVLEHKKTNPQDPSSPLKAAPLNFDDLEVEEEAETVFSQLPSSSNSTSDTDSSEDTLANPEEHETFQLKNVVAQKREVIDSPLAYAHAAIVQYVDAETIGPEVGVDAQETPIFLKAELEYNPLTRTVSRRNAEPSSGAPQRLNAGVPLPGRSRTNSTDSAKSGKSWTQRVRSLRAQALHRKE